VQLQAELDATRARLGIPGVSVAILLPDGTSWNGASGLADVGRTTPVTPATAFALGSISKTYTSALVLRLAAEGRINLDAAARRYLPGAAIDGRITVRQLLDHTSGLYDYFLSPTIDKALRAAPSTSWSTKRTLRYVGKSYFPPGRGWHYSNTNYLYLGLIAERVMGTPLAQTLRTRFFDPLALHGTWYQAVEKPRTALAHGYRFASVKVGGPPIDLSDGTGVAPFTSVVTAAAGAGSIAATSGDVAHWARALYSGAILGPDMTGQMLADVSRTMTYQPTVPYGLGVQSVMIDGRLTLGHSGRLLGFRAAVRYLPAQDLAIAVLTNQSRADPGIVVQRLLAVVFTPISACPRCMQPD
jgi:D-alanyl-D-alanine carboxypeptidase